MLRTFNAEKTENGYCYKSLGAFLSDRDEICYISEGEFSEIGSDTLKVDDEHIATMVNKGGVDTHNTISKAVRELCVDAGTPIIDNFIEYIARCAFDNCDWQCISTWLFDIDIAQEYADWCNERKYAFELYATNNVRDENGELLDECHHNEMFGRIYEYLGDDCYLYEEPSVLINKWETGDTH